MESAFRLLTMTHTGYMTEHRKHTSTKKQVTRIDSIVH